MDVDADEPVAAAADLDPVDIDTDPVVQETQQRREVARDRIQARYAGRLPVHRAFTLVSPSEVRPEVVGAVLTADRQHGPAPVVALVDLDADEPYMFVPNRLRGLVAERPATDAQPTVLDPVPCTTVTVPYISAFRDRSSRGRNQHGWSLSAGFGGEQGEWVLPAVVCPQTTRAQAMPPAVQTQYPWHRVGWQAVIGPDQAGRDTVIGLRAFIQRIVPANFDPDQPTGCPAGTTPQFQRVVETDRNVCEGIFTAVYEQFGHISRTDRQVLAKAARRTRP